MSRAVIYCRVSTVEQAQNMSLGNQQRSCVEYCERQGFEVDRIFIEEGASAKTANRPKFQAMLDYCRENKGRIDFVVVWKVDRFSRNTTDTAIVKLTLQGLGIRLRSVTEPFDDTSAGKLMEGILSVFAQFDNDVRGERCCGGMKSAVNAGRWTHRAPLGYLNIRNAVGEKAIGQDPDRAHLIRQGFEMFATGLYKAADVIAELHKRGLRTRQNEPVTKQSFAAMLRNPIYCGKLVQNKWGVSKRGNFEPIVDDETFAAVQAQLAGSVQSLRPHVRNHPDFPLRAFVRCSCGKPITGSNSTGRDGKKRGYYHCVKCNQVRSRKDTIEAAFVAELERVQLTPDAAKILRAMVLSGYQQQAAETVSAAISTKARLRELETKKDRLVEAHIYEKKLDAATYQRHLDKINQDIAIATMAANEAKEDEIDVERILMLAEQVLTNLGQLWLEYDLDQRQRLQQMVFPTGLVWDGETFGNIVTAPFFKVLTQPKVAKSKMVDDRLDDWKTFPNLKRLVEWLQQFARLAEIAKVAA